MNPTLLIAAKDVVLSIMALAAAGLVLKKALIERQSVSRNLPLEHPGWKALGPASQQSPWETETALAALTGVFTPYPVILQLRRLPSPHQGLLWFHESRNHFDPKTLFSSLTLRQTRWRRTSMVGLTLLGLACLLLSAYVVFHLIGQLPKVSWGKSLAEAVLAFWFMGLGMACAAAFGRYQRAHWLLDAIRTAGTAPPQGTLDHPATASMSTEISPPPVTIGAHPGDHGHGEGDGDPLQVGLQNPALETTR